MGCSTLSVFFVDVACASEAEAQDCSEEAHRR
jgi:hypothetical protein